MPPEGLPATARTGEGQLNAEAVTGIGLALGFIAAVAIAIGTFLVTRNGDSYGPTKRRKKLSNWLTVGGLLVLALSFGLQWWGLKLNNP